MKILEISAVDITLYKFLIPLMDELKKNGNDVHAVSNFKAYAQDFKKLGYPIHHIDFVRNLSPIHNFKALKQLIKLFKSEKPDCIHVHTPIAAMLARIAGKYCKVNVIIYTIHGLYTKFPFLQLEKLICRHCTDYIFTVNPSDKKYLTEHKFIAENKILNLNSVGISSQKFNPLNVSKLQKQQLKEEFNLKADIPVIGFVGRLVREKGILELIEAFIKVRKEINCQLLVIGSAEYGERDNSTIEIFKQKINESGFKNDVILAGHREDMVQCLSIMDIFVLPSYREGMAISPLEAMSMELPVIVTDIKGCREEVTPQTGILVPVKNSELLADAIKYLLQNKEKAILMGKNARKNIEKNFETERTVNEQIKIFNEFQKKF